MKTIKQLFFAGFCTLLLTACSNNDEGVVKEAADGAARGADNLIEGLKQMPAAIGEASRKVEKDIKDE